MEFKEVHKELVKFAKYVIQQSRSNLTRQKKNVTKDLYNSLSYKIIENKTSMQVLFFMEEYGDFVNSGVKGKSPSSLPQGAKNFGRQQAPYSIFKFGQMKSKGLRKAINKWVLRKPDLKGSVRGKDGKFISRKSLNYLITRSIYLSGIAPSFFFTKPFQRAVERLPDELLDQVVLDFDTYITDITEK